MASEKDRNLRRLIKKFRINFKPPNLGQLPSRHKSTFDQIRAIRDIRFNSYRAENPILNEEPWTAQTKRRAEWLSNRAAALIYQQRNEAGWRFDLENDVLHRFLVEVVWYSTLISVSCLEKLLTLPLVLTVGQEFGGPRSRRSSIQTTQPPAIFKREEKVECIALVLQNNAQEILSGYKMPSSYHILIGSSYDLGMNPLFDNRAEEMVIFDPLLSIHDVPKKPDRVVGLKKTRAFTNLLDTSALTDDIRSTPFVESQDPLLFPFLVLEAKREKHSDGFEEIQTQTAFPILELLQLQEGIKPNVSQEVNSIAPFVWFIANRGDNWRVYSCYVNEEDPKSYVGVPALTQPWSKHCHYLIH